MYSIAHQDTDQDPSPHPQVICSVQDNGFIERKQEICRSKLVIDNLVIRRVFGGRSHGVEETRGAKEKQ